ncbi:hypothetical protein MRB53_021443 [Persea americana]|uniref:Uncharacterized protein n=1 Tax=Persea americana TaxID=3435 RepID=A0ACC2L3M5_PERAE|nr:hypothetical protein MRB53_021443 [Persea americana]
MQSPYERLLGTKLNYGSFRVFGTRCYPCFRDYAKDKFDARSLPCVFLGYSHQFKGYRCLDPPTNRIYISRHVVFDEVTFPFRDPGSLHSFTETPLDLAVFTNWFSASDACEPLSCEPLSSEESKLSASHERRKFQTRDESALLYVPSCATTHGDNSSFTTISTQSDTAHLETGPPALLQTGPSALLQTGPLSPNVNDNTTPLPENTTSLPLVAHFQAPMSNPCPLPVVPTQHRMVTRLKDNIVKPNPKYFLATVEIPTEPKSLKSALKHPAPPSLGSTNKYLRGVTLASIVSTEATLVSLPITTGGIFSCCVS